MSNIKLSFTTLGCPDWDFYTIVNQAESMGYDGIEIRGIKDEMYLNKMEPFKPYNIENTKNLLKSKGLVISCLDTSCIFHDKNQFDQYVKEGFEAIDLANNLNVKFIRVFGNNLVKGENEDITYGRISEGLNLLCDYSKDKNVEVLLETHGDFADTDRITKVLDNVKGNIGVLWDINHPYKAYNESFEQTYKKIGKFIKHIHIKDSLGKGAGAVLKLVGKGDLPIRECINILKDNGYDGFISLEWEKKWHPELEDAEIAFEEFIKYIKKII